MEPVFLAGSTHVPSLRHRWPGLDSRQRDGRRDNAVLAAAVVELLEWKDAPHWQQHGNELIYTGYRRACGSVQECFFSWTYIHNETVNIYSHVVGAVIFFSMPAIVFAASIPPRLALATNTEVVVCSVYFLGVAICFILSVNFHTFMSHSPEAYLLGMKLDFQGILLLMWSSTIPLVYYSFPCRRTLGTSYMVATSVLAALCSAVTFWPRFNAPHLGHYRAVLFGSFGLASFVAPIAHGVALYGLELQSQRIGMCWIWATASCNGLGVVAYTLKFPERWFPRRFDLLGASHQIMHVMVLCAALSFSMSTVAAFDFHHSSEMLC